MSLDLASQEERIQSLADMLSLLAIVGGMEKSAVQRVLVSLGTALLDVRTPLVIDRDLASRLLVGIARESGERAAIEVASDMDFVARAWRPVLDDRLNLSPGDPYRPLPYAEILFALVNHSGYALADHGVFEQFGGPELLLPLGQLSAALRNYAIPRPGLTWDLVGLGDPSDQALVGSDAVNYFLLKTASSPVRLRVSEFERGAQDDARREHDILVEPPLFAAFVAGLLGDMLYWAARLRQHADPGREIWRRLANLLIPVAPAPPTPPPSGQPPRP